MHPYDLALNAEAAASEEVWTCPMHPEIRKSEPGQCPKCSMALVKKPS